jgi:hypothetical protein
MAYQYDEVKEDDLISMVDVDYHIQDFEEFLLAHSGLPVCMYTICPESVSTQQSDDVAFTFDADNNIHMHVVGGGHYVHPVWQWCIDTLMVSRWNVVLTYKVDKKRVAPHRYVVMLTPLAKWSFPATLFARIAGQKLSRLCPARPGGALELNVMTSSGMQRSIGRVMDYLPATVPAGVAEAVGVASRTGAQEMSTATAASYTGDKLTGAKLVEHARQKLPNTDQTVYPQEHTDKVRRFQLGNFDPDARPTLTPFGDFVVDACYAPDKTPDNMLAAIEGRMNKIKANLECTSAHEKYAREFIAMFIPNPPKLSMVSTDEVWDKQRTASQKEILKRAEVLGPLAPAFTESFMKAEAYAKVTDPRVISIIPPSSKLDYSKVMYAITSYMKDGKDSYAHWYCFSSYPAEVASRVVAIAEKAERIGLNTDMSRFDGHIGFACRVVEKMVLLSLFSDEKPLVNALHDMQYGIPGVTSYGHKYHTGYHRLSGSPETSLMNSIINALISYTAHRMAGEEPTTAYSRIGIVGGDDGFTVDVPVKQFEQAATFWGHEVKPVVIQRGAAGVEFLARVYGEGVWYGDPTSMCQLRRQMSKFFATPRFAPGITPGDKLRVKAYAYYLTDRHTPIIGPMVTAMVQRLRIGPRKVLELIARRKELRDIAYSVYNAPFEAQYPNERQDWMQVVAERELFAFDYTKFNTWLHGARTEAQFLSAPICWKDETPPATTNVAVVAGEFVPGAPVVPTSTAPLGQAAKDTVLERAKAAIQPPAQTSNATVPAVTTPAAQQPSAGQQPANAMPTAAQIDAIAKAAFALTQPATRGSQRGRLRGKRYRGPGRGARGSK